MSGAGNCFVTLDGRGRDVSAFREEARIRDLCREYRTDGLMILCESGSPADFGMEFYNPDGSGGMMCGNGGRCITAFADFLGIKPSAPGHYEFTAPDGLHSADILTKEDGVWTVRLRMKDVDEVKQMLGGYFLNTGTRHFVKFVDDVESMDVDSEGRALRRNPAFAPEGTNVDFVHPAADGLHVRTFEKGVEGETLACGTGITASAIAACFAGIVPVQAPDTAPGRVTVALKARRNWLQVDFVPAGDGFREVYLTGPAEFL